jgi:hypothetical protein
VLPGEVGQRTDHRLERSAVRQQRDDVRRRPGLRKIRDVPEPRLDDSSGLGCDASPSPGAVAAERRDARRRRPTAAACQRRQPVSGCAPRRRAQRPVRRLASPRPAW